MPLSIMWFRQDLRLEDNKALLQASLAGRVIPIYIYDTSPENKWPLGGASKWWLHHSLTSLRSAGVPLIVLKGDPLTILQELVHKTGALSVHWNRCYEPFHINRDKRIKKELKAETCSYNGSLLFEPWDIQNKQGTFFKIFTPFWKHCSQYLDSCDVTDSSNIQFEEIKSLGGAVDNLNLLPHSPNWAKGWEQLWTPGEEGAQQRLKEMVDNKIIHYKIGRDYPAKSVTSCLSPHLHFGEISPRQILKLINNKCDLTDANVQTFIAELGWREFAYHLLYHVPSLPEQPFREKFRGFEWESNSELFQAWCEGQTGYPIIDAGMRELWQTGTMHNRVRMIVASFLTKHCLVSWQQGEAWFWDTLLDADLASNAMNWQWVAGCGVDAAPYFRIFNPTTQSQKYDFDGEYIRKWVPELVGFSNRDVHEPWKTSMATQQSAKCIIGQDYPMPIIDLNFGRLRALEAYKNI